MAASTIATFSAFIKTYFNPQRVENMTKTGKPFFSRVKRNTEVAGDPWIVPMLTLNPQGQSANGLATAQANATNVQGQKWSINMGDYNGSVSIGDKVIKASRNNTGAFLDDKQTEIEGQFEQVSTNIAIYMFRNGGGATGQIAAGGITGNVITLTNPADAFNFEVNEHIVLSLGDGSSGADALKVAAGGIMPVITAVDAVNGKITVDNLALITTPVAAAADFIFRQGDFAGNVSQTTMIKGVDAYITASSTPPTLYGITNTVRANQLTRLSGCKVAQADLNGKGIEERIQLLGSYMQGRFKAMNGTGNYEGFLHPEDWQNLSTSLQSRGVRDLNKEDAESGLSYISIITGGRTVKVFSEPFAVKGTFYLLRMDNFVLGSYGELISPVQGDGLVLLRSATTNDYEYRLISYPALSNNAPGFSGRVGLT